MEFYTSELRKIRITLIIMTIVLVFTQGNREVTIDHSYDDQGSMDFNPKMVQLEKGHFGILKDGGDQLGVYYYNSDTNELKLKKQVSLFTLENLSQDSEEE